MIVTWIFPLCLGSFIFSGWEDELIPKPEFEPKYSCYGSRNTRSCFLHSKDREDTACFSYEKEFMGLPWWPSGWESTCQCREHRRRGFDPWVRKIPWRRKWQPTPVFLSGKCHDQQSLAGVTGVTKSWTGLSDSADTELHSQEEQGVGRAVSSVPQWHKSLHLKTRDAHICLVNW